MDLHRDFADLCSLLNANGVEFPIVVGYAVAFHGAPRFTGDLDILIHPTLDQVQRTLAAVKEFGFPSEQIAAHDVLGSGVNWESAWDNRQGGSYGSVPVFFILAPISASQQARGGPSQGSSRCGSAPHS